MSSNCLTPYFNVNTGLFCRCGKCEHCMTVKRNSWAFRMDRELKFGGSLFQTFVTLTYKDSDLTLLDKAWKRHYKFKNPFEYAVIKKGDLSDFLSDLQKRTKKECGKLQRYYALFEYGSLERRPHVHIILFSPLNEELTKKFVRESWDKISKDSIIDFQPITFADITYCAKHNLKQCGGNKFQNFIQPPYTSCSKYNGGIGIQFFIDNPNNQNKYTMLQNFRITQPEFYRKKSKAYQNLMQFDPEIRDMVLRDEKLLRRILALPEMQKLESKQRSFLSRIQLDQIRAQLVSYCKAYNLDFPQFSDPLQMVYFYKKTVLQKKRQENKRLFIARIARVNTKNCLKLKNIKFLKHLENGKSNFTNGRN